MARILVTGSTDGIGLATAAALLDEGHQVVVHARTQARLEALADLTDRGAATVVGDLGELAQVHDLAGQVEALGGVDVAVHNAGTMDDRLALPVNVVAPYVLIARLPQASRVIVVSSSMHRGGRPDLAGADWSGSRATRTYSDSKLYVTALSAALARLRPDVVSHAVDPGWVPTKMGGQSATDDLALAHVTQVWLATSTDSEALRSGGYWFHQRRQEPHPSVADEAFQQELLAALSEHTGVSLG